MKGLELVCTHIDDLMVITKGYAEDHQEKVKEVLRKLHYAKLSIAKPELEYLGYWTTYEEIMPQHKKVHGIL